MIRIIRGTYGYRDSDGLVHPKTYSDGPFEETEKQEAMLIRMGIAERVEKPKAPEKKEAKVCQPSKSRSAKTSKARS